MKRVTWRDKAIYSIADALLEYEDQCLLMGEAIEGKAAKKWISRDRFPFGFRKYTPYKTWLQEVAKIPHFISTGWPAETYPGWRSGLPKRPRKCRVSEGQLSLFKKVRSIRFTKTVLFLHLIHAKRSLIFP